MTEKTFDITKSDINKMFWRSLPIEISYNSERLHNMFYVYSLTPIFKKIYKDNPQAMKEALVRHMQFYNTCPQVEALVVGIVAALEVKNAESNNTMGDTVEAVKTSLMGPTGVIGDTFFQTGGFRIISASIGASMCIAGNPFGLLVYFLIYNVPNYLFHWWGIHQGFKYGTVFIDKVVNSGILQKVTDVCSIVGLSVIGALTSAYVSLSTPLKLEYGKQAIEIQKLFDDICPHLLPLLLTLLCAWLMRKKNVKPTILMIWVIIIGVILGSFGII
ncbi:MAG: PTS system mannose/fructose/sorbose family transporter subunit IID [Bacilli bacterium]|uniref:PTS system mannose/fructose/sorbose family transporter subunit IID n=1 Tax=Anaerorhabdus sp. TaxID=1872524 RepID=UPI002FCAEDF8